MLSKSIKCLAACRIATAMLTGCNEDLIPPAPVASFDSFVYPAYDYGASYWDADTSGGCSAKDSGGYWGGSQDESSLLAENIELCVPERHGDELQRPRVLLVAVAAPGLRKLD